MNTGAELYLDTARLGRMKRSAQGAVTDFARLSGQAALTLYGTNFFVHGFEALSARQRRGCPRLGSWGGIDQFKGTVLQYVEADSDQVCLLSSRSLALFRQGVMLMAQRCRRVLVPDLLWRPYTSVLHAIIREGGAQVEHLHLRRDVFVERNSGDDIVEQIATCFAATKCDAACLPAVTHDGVRLPLDRIIDRMRETAPKCFVLVDAAQGLGHVPSDFGINRADLVVAGAHKWVGAGMPLGIGIGSRKVVQELWDISGDDPLLALTSPNGFINGTETVNLWPLISSNAVLGEPRSPKRGVEGAFVTLVANRRAILRSIRGLNWSPVLPHRSLRSGILLLRNDRLQQGSRNSESMRAHFYNAGIVLSSYPDNLVRLSLPAKKIPEADLMRFVSALR